MVSQHTPHRDSIIGSGFSKLSLAFSRLMGGEGRYRSSGAKGWFGSSARWSIAIEEGGEVDFLGWQ